MSASRNRVSHPYVCSFHQHEYVEVFVDFVEVTKHSFCGGYRGYVETPETPRVDRHIL